jgi:hypothetical protein
MARFSTQRVLKKPYSNFTNEYKLVQIFIIDTLIET